jgi:hypothetical protein
LCLWTRRLFGERDGAFPFSRLIGPAPAPSTFMPTTAAHLDQIDFALSDPPSMRTKAGRRAKAEAVVRIESLNDTVRISSAFRTFDELIQDSIRTGYIPTLLTKPFNSSVPSLIRAVRAKRIADAFDWHMSVHQVRSPRDGHPMRAWRGSHAESSAQS